MPVEDDADGINPRVAQRRILVGQLRGELFGALPEAHREAKGPLYCRLLGACHRLPFRAFSRARPRSHTMGGESIEVAGSATPARGQLNSSRS